MYYNRPSTEPAITEDPETGLTVKVRKYNASFSIGIFKGRYKVAFVYKSPYQRKYEDYRSISNEQKRLQFSQYEFVAFQLLEAEEKLLMHEYHEAFQECLSKYPKPSYQIATV